MAGGGNPKQHATSPRHSEIRRARADSIDRALKRDSHRATRVLTELQLLRRVAEEARFLLIERSEVRLAGLAGAIAELDGA